MTEPPSKNSEPSEDEGARWWEIEIDANQAGEGGSFFLGLVAGLVGGLVVVLLVVRRAKPNTRMGVWFGVVLQVSLALWLARYLESTGALHLGPS